MTPMNFAMTTLLNGIFLGAILAAVMMLLLKFFPRLNATTRFTVLWMTLLALVALARHSAHSPSVIAGASNRIARRCLPKFGRNPRTCAGTSLPAGTQDSCFPRRLGCGEKTCVNIRATSGNAAFSECLHNFLACGIAIRTLSDSHSLGKVSSCAGNCVGDVLVRAACPVGRGILRFAKPEIKRKKPASPDWQLRFSRLCATHGIRRQPQLLVSSHVSGPMSLGFFRPTIVIPRTILETLSHSELEQIVLHELAHLHRRDDWSNLAQKLIEAVLPIQPAVYWLGYPISLAREMACDDWVIAATGAPRPYAAALTKVAELSQWQRAGVLAAGAAGEPFAALPPRPSGARSYAESSSQAYRRAAGLSLGRRRGAHLPERPSAAADCLLPKPRTRRQPDETNCNRSATGPAIATGSHDDDGCGFGSSRPNGPRGSAIRDCWYCTVRTSRSGGGAFAHVTAVSRIAAVSDEPAISHVAARPDGARSAAAEW